MVFVFVVMAMGGDNHLVEVYVAIGVLVVVSVFLASAFRDTRWRMSAAKKKLLGVHVE